MEFDVALEALKSDAAIWDDVSAALDGAARAASGLSLAPSAFSFAGGGVATTYESVRSAVESLLRGGALETSRAADTLLAVKRAYEQSDSAAGITFAGQWDRA